MNKKEVDCTKMPFMQDINKRSEQENQKLTEHIEMFAAAYIKKTDIDPTEAELIVKVLPEGGISYSFKKKEHHAWIKNSEGNYECHICHYICSELKSLKAQGHDSVLTDKGFIAIDKREIRPIVLEDGGVDNNFYGAWVNGKYRIELEYRKSGTLVVLGTFDSIEDADKYLKNMPCTRIV